MSLQCLDWPGNSPDANPIENLWKIIGTKVAALQPKNKTELRNCIAEIWSSFSIDTIRQLVRSMPKRCAAIIKAKGGATKY